MGKVALLFLGGTVEQKDILSIGKFDFVCCADSGLDSAIKFKIAPDIVIGDMDSISKDGLKYINQNSISTMKYPEDKNFTDGELAVQFLLHHKPQFSEIKVIGLIGNRPDHTFGNYLLLNNRINDIPITSFTQGFKIQVFRKGLHRFTSKPGAIVSIYALNSSAFIRLGRLKFRFEDTLTPFSSRCLSNITEDGEFSIETDSDILVFIQSQV